MATTGSLFSEFLLQLQPRLNLPGTVSIINPYRHDEVRGIVKQFCDQYYADSVKRILILGINPGRFGAGVTGIPFTDPFALEARCGISNSFQKKQELSSRFIYEMMEVYGGAYKFYGSFLLSAVCPLGFTQGNKNYNYYDSVALLKASSGFIKSSLKRHAGFNVNSTTVVSLGKKNASCLEAFNRELKLFENIVTLEHPRYIMQYKLKSKNKYIDEYCKQFDKI